MVNVIMHGCNGKMGRVITDLVSKDDNIQIVAGIDAYTGIANEYVEKFNKAISHTGRKNLNALNIGWDRVQLDDEYGKYLLGKIMDLERRLREDGNKE